MPSIRRRSAPNTATPSRSRASGEPVCWRSSDHVGDTFRAVYTVRFAAAVYVLHAFQKKSKAGIKTPAEDLKLIRRRLKAAEADHQLHFGKGKAP